MILSPVRPFTRHICILLAGIGLMTAMPVAGQGISMKETISYINGKFESGHSIDVIRGVVIAIYKEKGDVVREDQVSAGDLDTSHMAYDGQARIFSIDCKGAPSRKCVTRDLPMLDVYRSYARISWPATLDARSVSGLRKAFTHLVLLVTDRKYESSEPFE